MPRQFTSRWEIPFRQRSAGTCCLPSPKANWAGGKRGGRMLALGEFARVSQTQTASAIAVQVLRPPLRQRRSSSATDPRLRKGGQDGEFTWQSAQAGKGTSKTQLALSACRVPSRCADTLCIGLYRGGRHSAFAGPAPFAPSSKELAAGARPRYTQAKQPCTGNLPPAPTKDNVRNQKLWQGQHPTGTDGNTNQKQGFQRAFVCNEASPTQPSLLPLFTHLTSPHVPISWKGSESQNGRGWKGPLWVTQSNPLPKQGHPEQAAQHRIQAGLEYLQRRRLHNLPRQPVPGLRHPQREEFLPRVQMELPVLQFVPIAPCPVAGHH